ncbi:MAG TPA: DUF5985 family protein [Sphingomonas sp.]|nr:DUF5985 family protein [Sphingomonas sp.]
MPTLSSLVYLLCFVTSTVCALLLVRQYRIASSPLLLWSAACFGLLAASNLMVVIDLLVLPDIDLRPVRQALTLMAVCVLLFGFIWEAEQE